MYTAKDVNNAEKFADTNYKIAVIRKMYEKHPQIASWLKYKIRPATHDDYYMPGAIESSCKVIEIEITKELCELASCTPLKETEKCKSDDVASYYYVGDDKYDVQCQPACFNLAVSNTNAVKNHHRDTVVTTTTKSNDDAGMPEMIWNAQVGKCRLVNSSVKAALEKPFYRSEVKYEKRVNDLPIGFSRVDKPNDPYGVGYTYANNAAYCGFFDKSFDADTKECYVPTGEYIGGAIVGSAIINNVRASIRMMQTGSTLKMPENLPTLPSEMEKRFTLDGWRNSVNESFVLPEPIDTSPKMYLLRRQYQKRRKYRGKRETEIDDYDERYHEDDKKNEEIKRRREAELLDGRYSGFMLHHIRKPTPSYVHSKNDLIPGTHSSIYVKEHEGSYDENTKVKLVRFTDDDAIQNENNGKMIVNELNSVFNTLDEEISSSSSNNHSSSSSSYELYNDVINDRFKRNTNKADKNKITSTLKTVLIEILRTVTTDGDFYVQLGIGLAADGAVAAFRKIALKLVASLSGQFGKSLVQVVGKIGTNVLSSAFKSVVTKTFINGMVRVAATTALALAKIAATASTVVGVILIGFVILDLALTLWDPYGYNSLYPANYPSDAFYNGQVAMRQFTESGSLDVSFELLASYILTQNEIGLLQLSTIVDKIIYLDSLTVNSEGTRLEKGDLIEMSWVSESEMEDDEELQRAYRETLAKGAGWNAETFERYNRKFNKRIEAVQVLNYSAGASILLSGIFYFSRLPLLAVLCIVISIILFAGATITLQNDMIPDLFDKYTKTSSDGTFVGYPQA